MSVKHFTREALLNLLVIVLIIVALVLVANNKYNKHMDITDENCARMFGKDSGWFRCKYTNTCMMDEAYCFDVEPEHYCFSGEDYVWCGEKHVKGCLKKETYDMFCHPLELKRVLYDFYNLIGPDVKFSDRDNHQYRRFFEDETVLKVGTGQAASQTYSLEAKPNNKATAEDKPSAKTSSNQEISNVMEGENESKTNAGQTPLNNQEIAQENDGKSSLTEEHTDVETLVSVESKEFPEGTAQTTQGDASSLVKGPETVMNSPAKESHPAIEREPETMKNEEEAEVPKGSAGVGDVSSTVNEKQSSAPAAESNQHSLSEGVVKEVFRNEKLLHNLFKDF
eukprot:Nk52_evm3s2568 gene=Nk52_evmTU3s2568